MTLADPVVAAGAAGEAGISDVGEARPLRADVWRRFRRNPLAMLGLGFVVLLVLTAIFADVIAPFSITDRAEARQPPSWDHLFGTDSVGRDVFSRVVYGARVSLRIGSLVTIMAVSIGVLLGSAAGYFSGATDTILMRVTDVFLSIPYIVLAIAIATVFGRSENSIIIVLGVTGWLGIARIVRASFLSLKRLEYVEAAHSLGFKTSRIMFGHILPNALQPIIVYATVSIGAVILSEAALSFLNVGPQDPSPAWGLQVANAADRGALATFPHALLFPAGAIFLTVLAFVLVGDGLRDALDPKLKS